VKEEDCSSVDVIVGSVFDRPPDWILGMFAVADLGNVDSISSGI
jgi:hypothetical protein